MPHTPGPWRIGKVSGTVVSDYPTSYGTGHDDIDYYGGFCVAESIAKKDDARLIAAAPDLYAACIEVIASFNNAELDECQKVAIEMAKEAVGLAKGELEWVINESGIWKVQPTKNEKDPLGRADHHGGCEISCHVKHTTTASK